MHTKLETSPLFAHERVDDGRTGYRFAYIPAKATPVVTERKRTYCGHCGRQLSNAAHKETFCPRCGWLIDIASHPSKKGR